MGGYKSLIVYRLAVTIYDLNIEFCHSFLNSIKHRRTVDQMEQAARSGKQNIVEGSLEKSTASNITLTGVSRASYGELKEDYEDFLRINKLQLWLKTDARVLKIRSFRETLDINTNLSSLTNWTKFDFSNSENFANLMITLISKQTYLLDQLIASQERLFIQNGGFRENLFKKRKQYKNQFDK